MKHGPAIILCLFLSTIAITMPFTRISHQETFVPQGIQTSAYTVFVLINNESALAAFPGKTGSGIAGDPYIIDGLVIESKSADWAFYIGGTTSYVIIQNCRISNCHGVEIVGDGMGIYSQNVVVKNSKIEGCDYGITIRGSNNIFQNNNVSGNSYCGIVTGGMNNQVLNNLVNNNGKSGILVKDGTNVLVKGNTVSMNVEHGIFIYYTGSYASTTVTENIATNNGGFGIYSDYNSGGNIVTNNQAWGNRLGCVQDDGENAFSSNQCNMIPDWGIFLIISGITTTFTALVSWGIHKK